MPNNGDITADLNIFAFDEAIPVSEQVTLVEQLRATKAQMKGLVCSRYYHLREPGSWIEHLFWSGRQDTIMRGVPPAQAQATLDRLLASAGAEELL